MPDADNRTPEPILAIMIERYLRQWNRWSLRTFLKWSLTGEEAWWFIFQAENAMDRLEWLADHGLVVRGRTRCGGHCYKLASGVPMKRVRNAVATGQLEAV